MSRAKVTSPASHTDTELVTFVAIIATLCLASGTQWLRDTTWLDRFGPTDAQDVRHAISQMILTEARRGDLLGIQPKGNSTSSSAACRAYDFYPDLGAPSDPSS